MNATIVFVMMMMFLILIPSPLYASESSKDTPKSSSFKCSPCVHGKEASPNCVCKNPIKGSMYFPHASLKDVSNSTKNVLIHGLTAYLNSSSVHVESVVIRNATTDAIFQTLKVDISVFPMGRENFTQRELDVVSFALSNKTYKAPAILGSYYYKPQMYIYLHGEGGSDSPDKDAMITKAVSSGCGVLLMFFTAAVLYVLRKKKIAVREAGEHNVERAFNWIEMLEAMADMV